MCCSSAMAIAVVGTLGIGFMPGIVAPAVAEIPQSVRTQSGKVRCEVYADDTGHGGGPLVVCQRGNGEPFPQSPLSSQSDEQTNLAVVKGDGSFSWDIGNIAASAEAMASDHFLTYGQPYSVKGWTILPGYDGTRYSYDATGHGMFVSLDNVYSF